jgi:formylglycine-generating enzyme required for sulfatase activity
VIQAQYQQVMGNNPANFAQCGSNCPVEHVSWDDAQAFIQKLNRQTGQHYRLPTGAEWEYAARADTQTEYSWGDQPPVCDHQAANGAQFEDCQERATITVGNFPANPWGLHDMHGNVWEWVADCWQDTYRNALKDGKVRTSCSGDSSRVLRGGSWTYYPNGLRSATRDNFTADSRLSHIGFRVAKTD